MNYEIGIRTVKDFLDDAKYLTNINMQRKFIYTHEKSKYLLDSIQKMIPIPAIYLWDNGDGTYDVLDGKQRITVMRLYKNPNYLPDQTHNFFIDFMEDEAFENYKIPVIICKGTLQERIETFNRINTTAVPLKDFEKYNALFQGKFVEEFGDWGVSLSDNEALYFGRSIRGENCIKALQLFTDNVADYFHHNQNVSFVDGLKKQIEKVVGITNKIFGKYNKDHYILAKIVKENLNNQSILDTWELNKDKIVDLFEEYNANGELNLASSKESFYKEILKCYNITGLDSRRFFTVDTKKLLYKDLIDGTKKLLYKDLIDGTKKGYKICPFCHKEFDFNGFEVDHITPWSIGGKTSIENAQLLCKSCNSKKSDNIV